MCVVCFVFIFRFSVLILEGEVRSVLSGRRERERERFWEVVSERPRSTLLSPLFPSSSPSLPSSPLTS